MILHTIHPNARTCYPSSGHSNTVLTKMVTQAPQPAQSIVICIPWPTGRWSFRSTTICSRSRGTVVTTCTGCRGSGRRSRSRFWAPAALPSATRSWRTSRRSWSGICTRSWSIHCAWSRGTNSCTRGWGVVRPGSCPGSITPRIVTAGPRSRCRCSPCRCLGS